MLRSVRCLAITLIGAVLIGVICAAPVPGENDIQDSSYSNDFEEPEESEPIPSSSTTVRVPLPSSTTESSYDGVAVHSTTESAVDAYFEGPSSSTVETLHGSSSEDLPSSTTESVVHSNAGVPVRSTTESVADSNFGGSSEDLPSSTTESIARIISKVYGPPPDSPGRIAFAGGVHKFRIGQHEDETKRLLEEYNYHFVRVEQGLPHTTQRSTRFNPSS